MLAIVTAALAVVVATGSPAAAEGPCGVPVYAGDVNRVGNLVFVDDDDDGFFEPGAGEVGLSGVSVELWADVDFDGVFEPAGDDATGLRCTTATDGNGNYWFHDVASGIYFIAVESAPTGYISSTGSRTSPTLDHSDDGAPTAGYDSVTRSFTLNTAVTQPLGEAAPGLAAGADETAANVATPASDDDDSNLTIDLGFTPVEEPACLGLGNRVWLDRNGDGIAQSTETGINGVTVQLFAADADGEPTGSVIDSDVTVDGGYYFFSCVDPGEYVVVVPASNFTTSGPLANLDPTVAGPEGDEGNDGRSGTGGDVVGPAVTIDEGTAPTGEPDKPTGGSNDYDDPSDDNVNTEIDFGFIGLTLGNRVWLDTDGSGTQNGAEAGIEGVTVELWASDGSGPVGATPLATDVTDADGYYLFKGLAPGQYVVRIPAGNFGNGNVLNGLISTPGSSPANTNIDADDNGSGLARGPVDSTSVTLSAGDEPTGETDLSGPMDSFPSDDNANVTVDFGFVSTLVGGPEPAALGDKVWLDTNGNGVQDPTEPGVPGVTVTLMDGDGNSISSSTTNIDGVYGFDDLLPGDYSVCFDESTLPDDSEITDSNVGSNDAVDSDADAQGCTDQVTLGPGDEDLSLDLGIVPTAGDLGIDKTGVYANGKVTWTIVVTNNGSTRTESTITVLDVLPADVSFDSATGTSTSCSYEDSTRTVTCALGGGLDAGASTTVTIVTTMLSATDCAVTNTATVGSGDADSVSTNNTSTASLSDACASASTTTTVTNTSTSQGGSNLPVTGGNLSVVAALALLLGLAGWKLSAYGARLKADTLEERLGQ